jgi:hypothetical protein
MRRRYDLAPIPSRVTDVFKPGPGFLLLHVYSHTVAVAHRCAAVNRMNRKSPTITLALALALTTSGCRTAAERELIAVFETLNRALKTHDEALARSKFSPAEWSRQEGGQHLYEYLSTREWTLRLRREMHVRERAVLITDIVSGERVLDDLLLYLVQGEGQWQIDGNDENHEHPPLFLEGLTSAHFDAAELPGSAELEKLGVAMLSVAHEEEDQAAARATLNAAGLRASDISSYLNDLRREQLLRLGRSYVSAELGVGALVFGADRFSLPMTMYLVRTEGGWRIVDSTFRIDSRHFLHAHGRKP